MPLYLPGGGSAGPMTTAIEDLTTTGVIERTGAGTATTFAVSAYSKTLLDDADQAAARGTLGLGSIATQSAASVAITGGSIAGITDLAIADGGTGASTAGNARTNLGATAIGNALFTAVNEADARGAIGVTNPSRNRLINGGMAIDQRNNGAAQTITAGAALAYTIDRWYAYCTGVNVTGQQVQGATAGRFRYRFTGASGCTAIGFGQRIEQLNSADLAGTTATLSVDLANSLLTSVTWTAFYANTADTFGTLASPTRTQFATGTFTVSSTVTRYSNQITIPIQAVTGIEIVFTVGAQTSGTWTIGNVQLEPGIVATPFEVRLYGNELALCQRYFESINTYIGYFSTTGDRRGFFSFVALKRSTPTVVVRGFGGVAGTVERVPNGGGGTDIAVSSLAALPTGVLVILNGGAGEIGIFRVYPGSFANSEL